MPAWFVTATGTDVGKTFITQGLIRHHRAKGESADAFKPILSGFTHADAAASDSGVLLQAMGRAVSDDGLDRISPWRFAAPLSPDMAAAKEGRSVPFDDVVAHSRMLIQEAGSARRYIEGVGGIMVPLDERHTVLDWMAALELPLILVAGSYLGTLSHTLTALEVLRGRNLRVAALVVSETAGSTVGLAETVTTLTNFVNSIKVIAVPRLAAGSIHHPVFGELAAALI